MKALLFLLTTLSLPVFAQDASTYLNSFDQKVYSLKTKGVKDFAVDLENSKLTKALNDQMIFGKVSRVTFKVYWTANPERVAVDIEGLPEGFNEAKEDLKVRTLTVLENLLPIQFTKKFSGFKVSSASKPREIVMHDSSGVAPIPTYVLKFDATDKLSEIIGQKPVGTFVSTYDYGKDSFADGKWVLKSFTVLNTENGQSLKTKTDLRYGSSQGIGVLTQIEQTVEQTTKASTKPVSASETWEFKNYRINTGESLKHFLGEGSKKED